MYMNLKPNQHKRISFNTTIMTSLGFIAPPLLKFSSPPPKFNFLLRSPPKIGGWGLLPCTCSHNQQYFNNEMETKILPKS